MTITTTNHGSVQTRINGIGSALRCVAVVNHEMRARYLDRRDDFLEQPKLQDPAKRLHLAHPTANQCAHSVPVSASPSRLPAAAWPRAAYAADQSLPAAAWATVVVARAVSA